MTGGGPLGMYDVVTRAERYQAAILMETFLWTFTFKDHFEPKFRMPFRLMRGQRSSLFRCQNRMVKKVIPEHCLNKRVNWETCQIGIPGATAKDREDRRIPFNPKGRLAAILQRRSALGRDAYVFGSANGTYQPNIQTAWETLRLLAHGIDPRPGKEGVEWNRQQLQRIDLRWHDLRHEGACRLLADGVDIRIIQLMLGHASIQQTQRYLNVTDEELRRGLEVSWNNEGRPLRLASGS